MSGGDGCLVVMVPSRCGLLKGVLVVLVAVVGVLTYVVVTYMYLVGAGGDEC